MLPPTLTRIDIRGHNTTTCGRIEYVHDLTDNRLAAGESITLPEWKQAPAFELHIINGVADVVAHYECLMMLRHVVANGEAAHVVVIVHEPVEVASAALAAVSGRMAAELVAGKALRHISAGGRP